MVAQTAITDMAEKVAMAIFAVTLEQADETAWDDLDEETQAAFMAGAHAAIGAHGLWLQMNGYKTIPPGAVHVPTCQEEADAMMAAIMTFRNRPKLEKPPGLILPNGRSL